MIKMEGSIRICKIKGLLELQKISIETFSDTFAEQNDSDNLEEYLIEAYHLEKLKKGNDEFKFTFLFYLFR